MAQTQIPFGHPLARKVFGAALFAEMVRKPGFSKNLTGPAPGIAGAKQKFEKMQTSPAYPCVRVTDLSKGKGDTVSVDMFNIIQGKPVMGDTKLSGRMMSLTSSSMDVQLDQFRGGVDPGGRMTQHRTVHDLRTIGLANLAGWYARLADQYKLVHLAGARGAQNDPSWVLPLASDPDFNDIMVNAVHPPVASRHFYAGGEADVEAMDATDILTLEDIDRLRASIDEMDVPLQPVILPDDPAGTEDGLYVLYLSPRQWHYLLTRAGDKAIRHFHAQAQTRGSANPLFKGEVGMWNGILVKKLPRAVRFPSGSTMTVITDDVTLATATKTVPAFGGAAGAGVDRGILLGAQALAEVYGKHTKSSTHFSWHEEESDHGNTVEASISAITGSAKLRFKEAGGRWIDHGVVVIDSYAPNPRSVAIA